MKPRVLVMHFSGTHIGWDESKNSDAANVRDRDMHIQRATW